MDNIQIESTLSGITNRLDLCLDFLDEKMFTGRNIEYESILGLYEILEDLKNKVLAVYNHHVEQEDTTADLLANLERLVREKAVRRLKPCLKSSSALFRFKRSTKQAGQKAARTKNELDLLGTAVLQFADTNNFWEGTPSDLLANLERLAGEKAIKAKAWPKSPSAFSRYLNKFDTLLKNEGIMVQHSRTIRGRIIRLTKQE